MRRTTILQRSPSTERALTRPRPQLRGRSHLLAAVVVVPTAAVATWVAPAGRVRLGVAAFALSMAVMLTLSALLHLRSWPAATYERLLRLDHCGIYTAICGTAIALAVLGLERWPARILLTAAVVGLLLGVVVEWLPFAPPRGLNNTIYLTLGWTPALLLPWMWLGYGPLVVGLLVLGGLLYTVGAVIVGLRRPDPWPRWFGYHELFHLLVLVAIAAHAAMVAILVARHL